VSFRQRERNASGIEKRRTGDWLGSFSKARGNRRRLRGERSAAPAAARRLFCREKTKRLHIDGKRKKFSRHKEVRTSRQAPTRKKGAGSCGGWEEAHDEGEGKVIRCGSTALERTHQFAQRLRPTYWGTHPSAKPRAEKKAGRVPDF